jgi:hypothetical protein
VARHVGNLHARRFSLALHDVHLLCGGLQLLALGLKRGFRGRMLLLQNLHHILPIRHGWQVHNSKRAHLLPSQRSLHGLLSIISDLQLSSKALLQTRHPVLHVLGTTSSARAALQTRRPPTCSPLCVSDSSACLARRS